MITGSEIERAREDIAGIIDCYIELIPAVGYSLKGPCPFCRKGGAIDPLWVTPSRGLWYCFGCRDGGDVIKFVQQREQISFTAAVSFLLAWHDLEV